MTNQSVTLFIRKLQEGDEHAATPIWNHFFTRLVSLASGRLNAHVKRVTDGEDIAISAFASCCRGIVDGRFPELQSRDNLWAVLMQIAEYKASNANRDAHVQKRGGGKVRGESVFLKTADLTGQGLNGLPGCEPTPEFAAIVAEEYAVRLQGLDDQQAQVANLKLEGYRNREIAEKLGCSLAKVERKLKLIRASWTQQPEDQPPGPVPD